MLFSGKIFIIIVEMLCRREQFFSCFDLFVKCLPSKFFSGETEADMIAAGNGPTPGFRGAMPIGRQTVRSIIPVTSG